MPSRRRTRSGLTQNKLKQYIKKSLPYTRKLRSSTPMEYDPDTQRIRARLDNYATPAEIAEEAYRVCRKNAELRKELENVKKSVVVPTHLPIPVVTTSTTPSSSSNTPMADAITTTAGNVSAPPDPTADAKATIKALKNRVAVMEDALSEMRREAPKMRESMAWMWEIIGDNRVHVPRDLRDMYHGSMTVDAIDWMGGKKGGGGRKERGWKEGGGGGEKKSGGEKKGEGGLRADNVVVGRKRKGASPLADYSKRARVESGEEGELDG
ncbi:uncharacterized protein J4E84_003261 [Alternaria hordeiaustralica]|uniref:uncharacterized protein n=1 Tax=Alternaria hordeiaustralica TaxID=1187925 RepID=UPI0020C4C864|nr:uncharacterized protein J4E84_003261 [Alternaria hordeiaustralica]KAI4692292.1 hypothetical protein J4E84_003261 [Alternaria hordeiaustralica]